MTQSHLIVKEEGIHYFLMPEEPNVPRDLALLDYQMHNIRSDYDRWQEYDKDVQQAQSSAILCEDQKRAKEIIHEDVCSKVMDGYINIDHFKPKIGSIYPVPGIEFEVMYRDPTGKVHSTCYDNETPVARLIEHTAEKEPDWLGGPEPKDIKQLENEISRLQKEAIEYGKAKWYEAARAVLISMNGEVDEGDIPEFKP